MCTQKNFYMKILCFCVCGCILCVFMCTVKVWESLALSWPEQMWLWGGMGALGVFCIVSNYRLNICVRWCGGHDFHFHVHVFCVLCVCHTHMPCCNQTIDILRPGMTVWVMVTVFVMVTVMINIQEDSWCLILENTSWGEAGVNLSFQLGQI